MRLYSSTFDLPVTVCGIHTFVGYVAPSRLQKSSTIHLSLDAKDLFLSSVIVALLRWIMSLSAAEAPLRVLE